MKRDLSLSVKSLMRFFHHGFIFILLISLCTSCESRKVIVNALDEKEANEILVFLSSKGVDAVKVQALSEGAGGNKAILWNISVQTAQATEAMAMLNQVGLPRRRGQNLLGIFSNVSLVPSGLQEKIRFQAGLGEQIASTIRKIDGVLDADVQISFPDEDPLNPNAPKQKITASVYVKHAGVLDDPNAHLPTRIKRLVAGSVNGLDYDNVTVIGDRARFNEPNPGFQGDEERPFVHVWSLIIAKESLFRFRILFFSFTITLLVLLLTIIWLLWKLLPLLKQEGGIKQLFSLKPIDNDRLRDLSAQKTPSETEESKNEKKDDDESNE